MLSISGQPGLYETLTQKITVWRAVAGWGWGLGTRHDMIAL